MSKNVNFREPDFQEKTEKQNSVTNVANDLSKVNAK